MTTVLFHSVLGVRQGELDAAERLRAAGHEVLLPDLLEGRVFDAYDPAMAWSEQLGMERLFERGLEAVAHLPDGFVVGGFSQGSNIAGYVATRRSVSGVLQLAGLSVDEWFGSGAVWPAGVDSQAHQTLGDPFREDEITEQAKRDVAAAGGALELFDYPGDGHLFTDPTLPGEYDAQATELFWSRVLPFVGACGTTTYPRKERPMLDPASCDLDVIATALADQQSYDQRCLVDPATGEIAFWTSDGGIDGEHPVDLEDLDLIGIDPLPSYVWHRDMADFAEGLSDEQAAGRLSRAIQGRGAFRHFTSESHEEYPHLLAAWYAFRDARAQRRAVEWLVDNDLVDGAEAERFLNSQNDADLP